MSAVIGQRSIVRTHVEWVDSRTVAAAVFGVAITDTKNLAPRVVHQEGNGAGLLLKSCNHSVVVGVAATLDQIKDTVISIGAVAGIAGALRGLAGTGVTTLLIGVDACELVDAKQTAHRDLVHIRE